MTDNVEEMAIAEKYLKEMLEADDSKNFELYTKRYEKKYLANFTREIFLDDIKHMHEQNGMNIGYEFLCTLRSTKLDDLDVFRSVWKGIYEKRDAVIELGIYKNNGDWYVIVSVVHSQ